MLTKQGQSKLKSLGISFGSFLVNTAAALISANNPEVASLVEQTASVLSAHIASLEDTKEKRALKKAHAKIVKGITPAKEVVSPDVNVDGDTSGFLAPETVYSSPGRPTSHGLKHHTDDGADGDGV